MKPLHFVLVRFSSLGDVVLQTAIINWLKASYGERLKITFVTSVEFRDLVSGLPGVERVLVFDRRSGAKLKGLASEIRTLHAQDPITLMLDLHGTTRSFLLRLMLPEIPRLVVDKRRLERTLLVRLPISKRWANWRWLGLENQVERIALDWQGLLLAPFKRGDGPLTSVPTVAAMKHTKPYVVFAPVASFAPKRWPMDRFVELTRKFLADERWKNHDVVIIAGPSDTQCEALNVIQDERLINLQGKTKLKESVAWLAGAKVVVGNDSGMNHIAEAQGVPVLTLFGPTHEKFGFAPHLKNSEALSVDLWCRPCSNTGKRACFRSEQFCFTELTVDYVWERLSQRLVFT
jgi:heptosyltransferase-2